MYTWTVTRIMIEGQPVRRVFADDLKLLRSWQPKAGYFGAAATKCPAGSYCPDGASSPVACPSGTTSPPGARFATDCTVIAGYWGSPGRSVPVLQFLSCSRRSIASSGSTNLSVCRQPGDGLPRQLLLPCWRRGRDCMSCQHPEPRFIPNAYLHLALH